MAIRLVLSLFNLFTFSEIRTSLAARCDALIDEASSLLQAHQRPTSVELSALEDSALEDSEAEAAAITKMQLSQKSCTSLGPHWSAYSEATKQNLTQSGGVGGLGSSWLQVQGGLWFCVERNPHAANALSDIGFRVGKPGETPEKVCHLMGKGRIPVCDPLPSSDGTGLQLHLCGKFEPRSQSSKWVTTFNVGTAYKECTPRKGLDVNFVKVHAGGIRLMGVVPDFDPLLFCSHERLSETDERVRLEKGKSPLASEMTFPPKLLPVGHDLGNSSRRHVFVVGPEGSSTRFWTMLMGAGMGLDIAKLGNKEGGTNHIINNKAALFHISLPFGTTCEGQAVHNQPVLLDFGGTWDAYKTALGETGPVKTAFDLLLYHVDPLEVVKNHRQRGDLITMVVVIRDPRACLADKVLNHCKKPHVGREEQKKAYELMLKASEAHDKDVVVVCYEEMLAAGADYVHEKLALMGVTSSEKFNMENGNEKHQLKGHDCGIDMVAYSKLCPKTKLAEEVKASC